MAKEDTYILLLKKKSSLFVEGPGKKAVYPPIFKIPSFQIFGGETTLQLQFSFNVSFFFFFFFVLGFTQFCQGILP